ncbi:hypothetical protein SJAV_09080 [Sulfurisphaera javensis]|uniref:Uncharacterized protein n=2 Tax=Sulfurisphaera javensis TaxID=2049879 RepID=A0AAT9GQ67_9CREN
MRKMKLKEEHEEEKEDITEYWIDTKLITISLVIMVSVEVLIDLVIIATSGHKLFP